MKGIKIGSGPLIGGVTILQCRVEPVANVITRSTLGGTWLHQTVGTAAKRAAVQLVAVGQGTLIALQTAYVSGVTVTVYMDGYERTGLLPTAPVANDVMYRGAPDARANRISFTLNILSEVPL